MGVQKPGFFENTSSQLKDLVKTRFLWSECAILNLGKFIFFMTRRLKPRLHKRSPPPRTKRVFVYLKLNFIALTYGLSDFLNLLRCFHFSEESNRLLKMSLTIFGITHLLVS